MAAAVATVHTNKSARPSSLVLSLLLSLGLFPAKDGLS
jgi:hypothetical protein